MEKIIKIAVKIVGWGIVVCFLLFSFGNFNTAKQMKNDDIYEGIRYLQVVDCYDMEGNTSLEDFFAEETSFKMLKKAYEEMLNIFGNDYYEIGQQPIEYKGVCNFTEDLIVGGDEAKNQEVEELGTIITPLKSIQIGKETADTINLKKMVTWGRFFSEEDYMYDSSKKNIPLLLGSEYVDILNIGDTFSFYYLGEEEFAGEIVGFFEKNASIYTDENEIEILDDQIVMPSLETKSNAEIEKFLKKLYLTKTEGKIIYESNAKYDKITHEIERIKEDTGIQYSYIRDLRIVPENEEYNMTIIQAISLLVIAHIIFIFNFVLEIKRMGFTFVKRKLLKNIVIEAMVMLVSYGIIYKIIINYINNISLKLNIMRMRGIVQKELIVAWILLILIMIIKESNLSKED